VSNHDLTLIDSDKIAIWIGSCSGVGQEDQLSHLVPQYMGLAVAKKKSIDHTFGGKRANDLPEKLESWGLNQSRYRVLKRWRANCEQRRCTFQRAACMLIAYISISTMLCQ
jgi:hypothetical protein